MYIPVLEKVPELVVTESVIFHVPLRCTLDNGMEKPAHEEYSS